MNIIPFPKRAITRPFRTELYSETLPLFVVNSFREKSWEWRRETILENGDIADDRLIVGKASDSDEPRGVLKQVHQDIWYRLLKLWDEQDYPLTPDGKWGYIETTAYELVTTLRGNNSAKHYARVRELLYDLRTTPIIRQRYYPHTDTMDEAMFSLIADVTWAGQGLDRFKRPIHNSRSCVVVSFSQLITQQFLENRVKQLLLTPYLALAKTKGRRNELAPLLYPKLDRALANKDEYNVKLTRLFAELGLRNYRYKSKRRDKIRPALDLLMGQPILGERYHLRVSLRDSADGKDYVLVAQRTAQTDLFKE